MWPEPGGCLRRAPGLACQPTPALHQAPLCESVEQNPAFSNEARRGGCDGTHSVRIPRRRDRDGNYVTRRPSGSSAWPANGPLTKSRSSGVFSLPQGTVTRLHRALAPVFSTVRVAMKVGPSSCRGLSLSKNELFQLISSRRPWLLAAR